MKLARKRHQRAHALTVPATRPRNPLVAPALQRKAGAHGKSQKAQRRAARVALQRRDEAED